MSKQIYKLSELYDVKIGGTPDRSNQSYWEKGTNPWVSIKDMSDSKGVILKTSEKITDIGVKKSNVKLIPKGTVIMSFKLSLGKLAIAGMDLYTNEAICGFVNKRKDLIIDEYLYYVLSNLNLIDSADVAVKGATLNKEKIENLEIEVPESIEEQKRIAEILTNVDENIANIEKEIKQLDNIKTGLVLKLTSKYEDVKSLSELGDIVGGLTYSPNDVVNEGGKIVLRSPNISEDGLLELKDIVRVEKNIGKSCLKHNDILICVRNGSKRLIGKSLLIDKRVEGESFGAFMSVFRTKYSRYIYNLFNSPIIKEQISKNLGATINQITNKDINEYRIPFPFEESELLVFNEIMENFLNLIEIKKKELKKLRNIKISFLDMLI